MVIKDKIRIQFNANTKERIAFKAVKLKIEPPLLMYKFNHFKMSLLATI